MSYQFSCYGFAADIGSIFFGMDKSNKLKRIIVQIVCMICFQIPLGLLKDISKLQYASLVGTFALFYTIIVIVVESFWYFPIYYPHPPGDPSFDNTKLFRPLNFGYFDTYTCFLFGFSSHNGIFQIYSELKRQSKVRINKVLLRSLFFEIFLYLLISYAGFYSTFYQTEGVFLERPDILFNKKDYLIYIAKAALFICLHCVMAINYNIMRMSFKTMFFKGEQIPFFKNFIITVFIMLFSNILVFFVQRITDILGVIGGFCTVVICFINPIIIKIKLSGEPLTSSSNIFSIFILIISSTFGIAGTLKALIWKFLPDTVINSLIIN